MDAADWDRRYEGAELLWTAEPNRFLVAEVADLPPGRALDLACGEGRNAVWLAERGWQVVGVDFSPVGLNKAKALARARGVAASQIDWVLADLTQGDGGWEPEPPGFDLVAWMYFHPSPEVRRAILGRAVAALAPGGTILIVAHHLDNLEHGWGGPPYPEILLVPEVVAAELSDLGATIEKAETVLRPPREDKQEGERAAIDALIRARRTL
ncbi:MAG: class I SAM-dependent methyltransferase [Actinobacteria bacterium]|nr:class I SAM-dependent methyltransferase [Actinomycetota bacterium]